VREILKCIVHTIIFNRALGHVSPRDVDLQLLDVSYVEVCDEEIERQVEAGLRKVQDFLRTQQRRNVKSQKQVRSTFFAPLHGLGAPGIVF
jgi:autophagy-related protein 101